jgi:Sulfotransferase family
MTNKRDADLRESQGANGARHKSGGYVGAWRSGLRERSNFKDVQAFCMFIGQPFSGHSLVGSLLDAHRHAVIAHELDALRYVKARYARSQLFGLIIDKDRAFTQQGRRFTGYEYVVPNQWQGRWEKLLVIGDKKGGKSTTWLAENPELLGRLRATVKVPLRIINVVRNPFDNIATIRKRSIQFGRKASWDQPGATEDYFSRCDTIEELKKTIRDEEIIDVKLESMVTDAGATLRSLCGFLGIDSPEDYVNDCAEIVFASPRKTRSQEDWTPETIAEIERRLARFDFLDGYTFEN